MRLLPVSAIAVLASLITACSYDTDTTESSSSVTDPSTASADAKAAVRPPPLLADLVLIDRDPPADPGALPADAPHVRVPLLLPPPPKDGAAAKPCVVLRGEALAPPKDAPPPLPPPGEAAPPAPGKGVPKAAGLEGLDESLTAAKAEDGAIHAEKPGPTVVQIAVFDEAPPLPERGDAAPTGGPPPKDAGVRPVAIATCVLAPDADPRALPEEVLKDLLSGTHPSGAVAHVAVAHLPPPPKDGKAPPPKSAEGDGTAPGADAKGPPPPPPVRGTLRVVPLSDLAKAK